MSFNPGLDTYTAARDQQRVAIATGLSNIDATQTLPFLLDGITGRLLVSATTVLSATWFNETPVGLINGSNTIFTLSQTPAGNSLVLTLDRQPQILGVDYTISGNTITYLAAPDASLSGTPHNAIYAISGGAITGTIFVETPGGLINGSNRAYTTLNTINTVIGIWLNGEFIDPAQYVVSGAGFTMNVAIPSAFSGLPFTITYT